MRDAIKTTIQRLTKQGTERVGQLREGATWKRIKAGVSTPVGWLGCASEGVKGFFVSGSPVTYVGLSLGTIALLFMVVGFLITDDSYTDLGRVFLGIAVILVITEQLAQRRQEKQE